VHELVHMYDHAVFEVDWSNLRHHACSKVRLAVILYSSIYKHCYTFQDPREQFEWRLLFGTRISAWDLILFKAAPGKRTESDR